MARQVPLLLFLASFVTCAACAPTHLVVLQHGLYGNAVNLCVLQEELKAATSKNDVLVHLAASNEMSATRDGIAAGGARLAAEIREITAKRDTLTKLSLVGNSLGGLYVRYAAAELLDSRADSGATTMAGGLIPDALVTTGAPHLGVRKFTFLPLPPALFAAGRTIAGQTAVDLLLLDADDEAARDDDCSPPLLVQMSDSSSRYGCALRAFRRRRLYANLFGDVRVNQQSNSKYPGLTHKLTYRALF